MKGFCDSCTEQTEVEQYEYKGIVFYWCEYCKEEDSE